MPKTHSTYEAPRATTGLPPALANINSNVLDDAILKKLIDPDVYYEFARCRATGLSMDRYSRDELAKSIREWAQSKGCIGYSHWFSPMRGPIHGEKLETFVGVDFETDRLVINLSGRELFQTETDGSSFPNGGLRETHEAAAYIGWDTNSPPFVYRQTLYIPSAFVSWNGEALDQKTPLLRANLAVNEQSVRLLHHLGETELTEVVCNVGWEQEFFLVDRDKYLRRPDLVATGRTLVGATPFRGQEQSTSYFSKLSPRVNRYVAEAREKMWELGISIHCTHNEVAPAQHEISPIFNLANLAADTNVLAMDVLRDLAFDHGFAVLFHEKPFAGINGNGKHNNWGLNTDAGANLFVPGDTEYENRRFVAFVAALLRGVNKHGDLLRCGVSTAGNDHRLGAQEAPPAIITLHVGKILEAHLKAAANGGPIAGYGMEAKEIPVSAPVADIRANLEDRNRTAPFPWCGNRFEFRAVGGNQHIAFPLTMVNAAFADSLLHMCAGNRERQGDRPGDPGDDPGKPGRPVQWQRLLQRTLRVRREVEAIPFEEQSRCASRVDVVQERSVVLRTRYLQRTRDRGAPASSRGSLCYGTQDRGAHAGGDFAYPDSAGGHRRLQERSRIRIRLQAL